MPITLVTGLPGHGKTLYTLARWKDEALKNGRPVFHNGIPDLNIPGWQTFDVKEWQSLPPNSIAVVDEAQFAFPVTGRGQTPEWVQKLATHRHLGLDLVVITQGPMLLDSFVRQLVDRHFHVVRTFGLNRATIHEFANGVKDNVLKNRQGSIRHEWRYPKDVFGLYKSAEMHTVKARLPAKVWILLASPVVFIALATAAYYRLRPEAALEQAQKTQRAAQTDGKPSGTSSGSSAAGAGKGRGSEPMTPLEYAQAHTPRLQGLAHTAPIYDEVTRPAHAPYPAACVASKKRCQCYSQQATRLDVPDALCRSIADGGFFIAWNQQVAQAYPVQQPQQVAQQAPQPTQLPPQVIGINGGGPGAPAAVAGMAPSMQPAEQGPPPVRVRR